MEDITSNNNIPQNELFTEANVTSTDLHDVIRESKIFLENTPIAELEKIFATHQKEISFTSYLGNFDQKVQEAAEEQLSPLVVGFLNPQTTIYGKFITENNQNKHSNIYKKNSIAGFRKDIQEAIKICWIDIDDIKKTYEENNTTTYGNQREAIFKKIRPIYIQLRKQGYTSYDLIY